MSEFFKALEQAERDRQRKDEVGATSAPAPSLTAANEVRTLTPPPPVAVPPVKPAEVKPGVRREPAAAPRQRLDTPASTGSVFRKSLRRADRRPLQARITEQHPLLIAHSDPSSVEAAAYRTVRTNIELMTPAQACLHVAVTSVAGGDGKSTSAANLAVVAAQGGRRVCLVDADLRRPILHEVFGLPNVDGLALALEDGKPLHAVAALTDVDNLSVVVAGRTAHERFRDLCTPPRLQKLLQESEAAYDLVVFDTPPIIAVSDALNIAAVCDGVVLVVRAGSVPLSVLERAVGQIGQVKGRVLGVLLNRVDLRTTDADFYRYYRAYHSTSAKP
jgi:protein-tyrosine kinase